MIRVLVLKQLYNLSDEQMEYQLPDSMSYQRCCLYEQSLNVPDRNTIWRLGQSLGVDGAMALFSKEERSELLEGQSPDWSESKRRQKDTDASFTRMHGKSYFSFKLSVSVDYKNNFIQGIATGTASEHDGHHFDEELDMSNAGKAVDAYKGFDSAQRREMLKASDLKNGIQRKAHKTNH